MATVSAETRNALCIRGTAFNQNQIVDVSECIDDHGETIGAAHGLADIRIALRDDIGCRGTIRMDAIGKSGFAGQQIRDSGKIAPGRHQTRRAGRSRHVDEHHALAAIGQLAGESDRTKRAIVARWRNRKSDPRLLVDEKIGHGCDREFVMLLDSLGRGDLGRDDLLHLLDQIFVRGNVQ